MYNSKMNACATTKEWTSIWGMQFLLPKRKTEWAEHEKCKCVLRNNKLYFFAFADESDTVPPKYRSKTNRKTTKLRIFCFITRYWLLNAIWCHGSSGNSISIQTHFYCSKEHLVRTSPWPPLCLSLSISQQIDYKQNKYAFISSNLMCCRATAKAI